MNMVYSVQYTAYINTVSVLKSSWKKLSNDAIEFGISEVLQKQI